MNSILYLNDGGKLPLRTHGRLGAACLAGYISNLSRECKPHTVMSTTTPESSPTLHLAQQVQHNLQHQHLWTCLRLHTQPSLPRPLLSGLPPKRLYTHPDEQTALLKTGVKEAAPQREWVLPTHIRERWTLQDFAETFDGIRKAQNGEQGDEDVNEEVTGRSWDGKRRVLLATVNDDSTIVYYIVHDGVVKPRQN